MPTRTSAHAKCAAWREHDGLHLVCARSKGHTESADRARAKHYDPDRGLFWTDKGAVTR